MSHRVLCLLLLLLTACTQPAEPLRIGTNIWIGYEPLYLSRELNLFSAEDARLVEYTSAIQVMEAFADGAIEAAALTLDEALLMQQKGGNARIVLVMDYSNGADALLARPEIANLQSLKGKRIGVEDTATGAYLLDRAMHHAGIASQDIKVIPIDIYSHESAYNSGTVDAVVTFEPVKGKLLAAGARNLFDSSRIPDEIVDVLVVRDDLDRRRIVQLKAVIKAWFGALEHLRQHPEESVSLMSPRLKLDAKETLQALEGIGLPNEAENIRLLQGPSAKLAESARKLADLMVRHELLLHDPHPEALLDSSLLEKIYP